MVSFDDSQWELVDAPHDMLIKQAFSESNEASQAFLPRNQGWYRKHFVLPADWKGSAVWVYFEGVFHVTTAWLNGVPLSGSPHDAGYTSFALRLDDVPGARFGLENVLALHVDATFGDGWWYEGGGLFRHQYLIKTPLAASLGPLGDSVRVTPQLASHPTAETVNDAALSVSVTIANYDPTTAAPTRDDVGVSLQLSDAEGRVVATAQDSVVPPTRTSPTAWTTKLDLSGVDVHAWSIQRPYLYSLETKLKVGDNETDTTSIHSIGFRSINFTATNGLVRHSSLISPYLP